MMVTDSIKAGNPTVLGFSKEREKQQDGWMDREREKEFIREIESYNYEG